MDSVPATMRAVVVEAAGSPPVVKDVPVPTPGEGQVLIRVDSTPINPSDLLSLVGAYDTRPYPFTPGIEGSGVVVSPGPLQGQRVSFAAHVPYGTYAQYAISYVATTVTVDESVPLQVAASSFVNPGTVIGFLDVVQKQGVPAIVHTAAASALGRMLVRYAAVKGVKVINVVRRQDQADILKKEGAEYILNQTDADFDAQLTKLTTELKATIAFDAIGGEFTGRLATALPNGSTVYVYGALSGQGVSGVSPLDLIFKEKTVTGFWLASWIKKDLANFTFIQQEVKQHITTVFRSEIAKEFPVSAFGEAVEFYKNNMSAGKTLVRPNLEA